MTRDPYTVHKDKRRGGEKERFRKGGEFWVQVGVERTRYEERESVILERRRFTNFGYYGYGQ